MPIIKNYKNLFEYMCEAMSCGVSSHGFSSKKMLSYASHVPLTKSVIEFFPHNNIFEFGTGFFSTKVFYDNFKKRFTTVEDDEGWLNIISKEFDAKKGFNLLQSPINKKFNNVNNDKIDPKKLSKEEYKFIKSYYDDILSLNEPWDVVFIDQAKQGRAISARSSYGKANIILFHDLRRMDFFNYQHVFEKFADTEYSCYCYNTIPTWTGMLVNENAIDFSKRVREKFKIVLINNEKKFFESVSDRFPELGYLKDPMRFRFRGIRMKEVKI